MFVITAKYMALFSFLLYITKYIYFSYNEIKLIFVIDRFLKTNKKGLPALSSTSSPVGPITTPERGA